MNPPFYRACRKHKVELEDRTANAGFGPEILWCKSGHGGGHRCRSWDVRDMVGAIVAVAFTNKAPQIESVELLGLEFGAPKKRCENGHFEWKENKEGRYVCVKCESKTRLEKLAKKAAEIERAQKRLVRQTQQPKLKRKVNRATWRVMRGLEALKEQVEQRRLERALKIVQNRIEREQRCQRTQRLS